MHKRGTEMTGHDKLVISLSVIFSVLTISVIGIVAFESLRRRRRRGAFNRGLTPIGDDEIATWKVDLADQAAAEHYMPNPGHVHKDSTSSARIQYPWGGRQSVEAAMSPRSFILGGYSGYSGYSSELPQIPEPAAFALAPNARTGLTDGTIPGADPFVTPMERQSVRLQKFMPSSPKSHRNSRTRFSRSHGQLERWQSSAHSSFASTFMPLNGYSYYEKDIRTELSPPPSRRQDDTGRTLD
ncbi:hypothetical protein GGS21DRAFT_493798 [Xylaria nigripes]|nr:hypothetical protein GGS21DRAFT_493798 [Xylaria nigripes]